MMRLTATTLLSAFLAIACNSLSSTGSGAAKRASYVMRVDRTYDRSVVSKLPNDELGAESYKSMPPTDQWEATIYGAKIVISSIGTAAEHFEGHEVTVAGSPSTEQGVKRFDIDKGMFAGGRFVLRGEEAELTTYGSGVPIVASERGKLVTR